MRYRHMRHLEGSSTISRTKIAAAAGLGIFAAMLLPGCGTSPKADSDNPANAPRAAVVKVTRQDLANSLQIASEFQPYQEVEIYAKVSGYIQKLYVDWGTHVRAGQLLAVLEIPELEQQIQLDQAAVRRSEHDLARANDEVSQSQSSYDVAHVTYTRLANVQKTQPDLISQEEIDVARGKDQEAQAAVSGAKDALAAAEQGLAVSKSALDKDKALYDYSRIVAPFNGIVTELDAYTGALLPAGTSATKGDQPLCRLSQNDELRLVIPVPERAVPEIHVGQTVGITVSTLNKAYEGKIVRFADQIDTETRTMHTEVQVPNPKFELVPGMYASVSIPIESAAAALAVPVQCVRASGNGNGAVLVVNKDDRIEQRAVKLGLQTATLYEVLSGLQENDLVIFGEQSQYRPGERVSPAAVSGSATE